MRPGDLFLPSDPLHSLTGRFRASINNKKEARDAKTREGHKAQGKGETQPVRSSEASMGQAPRENHLRNQASHRREEKSCRSEALSRVKRSMERQASVRNIPSDKSGKEV